MFKNKDIPAWPYVRARVKPKFEKAGIRCCELQDEGYCNSDGDPICKGGSLTYRTFAHSMKRIDIATSGDKYKMEEVIWACSPCHGELESLGREPMYEKVRQIIAKRRVPVESIYRK